MKSTIITLLLTAATAAAANGAALRNDSISLDWKKVKGAWTLSSVSAFGLKGEPSAAGDVVLFSADKPSAEPLPPSEFGGDATFPEKEYRYVHPSWREATGAVALNRAGTCLPVRFTRLHAEGDSAVTLTADCNEFSLSRRWSIDGSDVKVVTTLTARRAGWYSIPTPSVITATPESLDFALIPGVLHGSRIADNFSHAYAYGWDIPAQPVLFRERSASTLTSILTTKNGLTLAVTAEPSTAAEPWGDSARSSDWRLGLSAMNREGSLSPTLYHPVLGEAGSYLEPGATVTFAARLTFGHEGWWAVFNHVADSIYGFGDALALRRNRRSLTDRLYSIHGYVVNDSTSRWHTVEADGDTIGAQEYLGGVYMAKKDAMKNADYGAMWMLGALTGDTLLTKKRLPYAINFKIKQHNSDCGFLKGASRGQYYLRDSRRFVEEWGPYTEPIATTYYLLTDLGNIALFEPDNSRVRELIRSAADWLLGVQKADGSWAVAYSDADFSEAFTDLKDLRPTFYGLLVAHRILGDAKYLDGARRGADWLIENAVGPQQWLGVCGDTRFAPDFATAQAAQALVELHDATADSRYLDAAIATARFYTTSVYTAPTASRRPVSVKGKPMEQWQITTSGLSYEHGGIIGSTNLHGPILLASHAGMFVRMYRLTGNRLFLDMARAAAIGRDAFVDDDTAVASYYWAAMNKGAGPYPHHAWWQTGWITDYLLAELELRSNGAISFPAGFITPKVGPHRTYAFAPGTIDGETAELVMLPGRIACSNPDVEYLTARSADSLYIMLLNDINEPQNARIDIDGKSLTATVAPYGLEIIKIPSKK